MGREVKRVPAGFAWPLGKVWFGYDMDSIPCQLCNGTGDRPQGPTKTRWAEGAQLYETEYCEACGGEGEVFPRIELPMGDAWQMWETTSEGSPMSPPFDTPEALAQWLANNGVPAFGGMTATYDEWLAMIGVGSSVSAVVHIPTDSSPGTIESGVAATLPPPPRQERRMITDTDKKERKHRYMKKWRQLHPNYARDWRRARNETSTAAVRRWRAAHPATAKLQNRQRGIFLRDGDVTGGQLRSICKRYGGRCAYCGIVVAVDCSPSWPIGFDHVVPQSKGGRHTKANVVVCCRACNASKHASTDDGWTPKVFS